MRSELTTLAARLTPVLREAGFTADAIAAHLGPEMTEAMHRGEPAAVRFATRRQGRLDQLIRTFILRDPLSPAQLEELIGAELTQALIDAAVFTADQDLLRLDMDIRPHVILGRDRMVFSDADAAMTEHIPGPEHVLGVGAASLSLLQATPDSPVGTVLDLGTGSGVQALGQLHCADHITATDLHPRALDFAEATLGAAVDKQAEIELLEGPWYEPVQGRTFDRIIANPPFVVGLPEVGHVYRDSGLDLDGASALVIGQALEHLNTGGTAHFLAAWIHTSEQSWAHRVASWFPETGVSAWVIQRDVADPAHYVGTWLRDESLDPRSAESDARTAAWLQHFADAGVTGVGFGFVAMKNIGDQPTEILAEEMTQSFTDPLSPEIEEYFTRVEWLRDLNPEEFGDSRFQLRPGVAREDISLPDTDAGVGFTPAVMRLTRTEGPRWSHEVDSHLAAIVAGLHPQGLSLAETVELYAMAQGLDSEELLPAAVNAVGDLVRHGLVVPADLIITE
ncbi:Ribosomal RNA small subunit methyltransferase C [Corynebacterium occultum]|uniref:Ribosomal RNA small subunit methyltransferase C n=1 Tax=Corynebacterium occultum TaxID=2675219 RepID=A0A6B8W9R6_9CORY|nr:class I SAM-dependent methyltransferase [Corynebacterium occultum]QGU07586.1 Ribosomal RNA small subunit methyltransferase C [Corynebacterium occultum]